MSITHSHAMSITDSEAMPITFLGIRAARSGRKAR
jgi:hypothetical protein